MTDSDRKRNLRALRLALIVTGYAAMALWLCLNVSWWFATLFVLPILYIVIGVMMALAEINDKPNNDKRQ